MESEPLSRVLVGRGIDKKSLPKHLAKKLSITDRRDHPTDMSREHEVEEGKRNEGNCAITINIDIICILQFYDDCSILT